jgi:hypothetical protein
MLNVCAPVCRAAGRAGARRRFSRRSARAVLRGRFRRFRADPLRARVHAA